MDWMNEAIMSYKNLLEEGFEIYKDKGKAIDYANENTCVGKKAKELALNEWN